MTAARIKELWHADPFVPFTIHLANGQQVRVPHPDFIAMSPTGRIASIFGPKGENHYVDTLLVVNVEVDGPPPSKRPTPRRSAPRRAR